MLVTCFCGEEYDESELKSRAQHAWCDWQPAAEMAEGLVRDTIPDGFIPERDTIPPPEHAE